MKDPSICIILGNGPSLKDVSNDLLDNFYTFGSNGIYDKYIPDFYVCINLLEADRRKQIIESLESFRLINSEANIQCEVQLNSLGPEFSFDPYSAICQGNTVTYVCLQLAYFYGFKTVYLLGIDHKYSHPGNPDEEIVWRGDDVNHFSPSYIHDGDSWNCPNLEMSEHYYRLALNVFKRNRRKIINLTKGTALTVFPIKDEDVLLTHLR
jgi:hypothetical protein